MHKILVIDDERLIRENISNILKMNDYEVVEAEFGMDGLHLAASEAPDLILCDMRLDDIDGYQVLAEIRNHPGTARIPFVFITGTTDRHSIRQGLNAGADDYLAKPFTITELLNMVAVWVEYSQGTTGSSLKVSTTS